jgi:hypothetical protein
MPTTPARASGSTATSSPSRRSVVLPTVVACPHVVDGRAHLSYPCLGPGMTRNRAKGFGCQNLWPALVVKQVDTASDLAWYVDEGSSSYLQHTPDIAGTARSAVRSMLAYTGCYGPTPGMKREKDVDLTVDGRPAHLVQTLFTVSASYRAMHNLAVRQERLWIVAVEVLPGYVALWLASVPDVERDLWPRVPAVIKAIRVV